MAKTRSSTDGFQIVGKKKNKQKENTLPKFLIPASDLLDENYRLEANVLLKKLKKRCNTRLARTAWLVLMLGSLGDTSNKEAEFQSNDILVKLGKTEIPAFLQVKYYYYRQILLFKKQDAYKRLKKTDEVAALENELAENTQQLEAMLQNLSPEFPQFSLVQTLIVKYYARAGKFETANLLVEKLHQLFPERDYLCIKSMLILAKYDRPDLREMAISQATSLLQDMPVHLHNLTFIHALQKVTAERITMTKDQFDNMLAHPNNRIATLNMLGRIMEQIGRLEWVDECYKAIFASGYYPGEYNSYGHLLAKRKSHEEAFEVLKNVVDYQTLHAEESPPSYRQLSIAYQIMLISLRKLAIKNASYKISFSIYMERAIAHANQHPTLLFNGTLWSTIGHSYADIHNNKLKAQECWAKALICDPHRIENHAPHLNPTLVSTIDAPVSLSCMMMPNLKVLTRFLIS